MNLIQGSLLLIIGSFLMHQTSGQIWDKNCKYFFENGSFVDLSPLDNPESPMKTGNVSDSDYSIYIFNPCTDIKCDEKNLGSVCYSEKTGNETDFGLWSNSSMQWANEDKILSQVYSLGPYPAEIQCICLENQTDPMFSSIPFQFPIFLLVSQHCCAQTVEPRHDSAAYIVLLIIIVAIILVMVALVAFSKKLRRRLQKLRERNTKGSLNPVFLE